MDQSEVHMAVIAMQQLPKIHNALSNMARRSRRRLERKGIFLGGFWPASNEEIPKLRGILKSPVTPNLGQLSTYNEFWKSFSYSCKANDFDNLINSGDSSPLCRSHKVSHFTPSPVLTRMSQSYDGNKEVYKSKTVALLNSTPVHISNEESLKQIYLAHLKNILLPSEECEILLELQHLKTLACISFHKLLRKRPLEYVLPLPRKAPRTALTRSKALVSYQSVQNLPTNDYKIRWLRFNSKNYTKNFSECGNDPPRCVVSKKSAKKGGFYYATTIPKGVAFLTYPDFFDNTSFEGTIGGRNIISWEQGTKFPQMGIDQSEEFKCKREMGRQQMVRNRLQAASRIHNRICRNAQDMEKANLDGFADIEAARSRSQFLYVPKKKSFTRKYHRKNQFPQLTIHRRSQFKLKSIMWNPFRSSRGCRVENLSVHSSTDSLSTAQMCLPTHTEVRKRFTCRGQAVTRAERRKRLKICFRITVGCLSCGIIPLLTKGECIFRKRRLRTMRTEDSRETESPVSEQRK